MPPLYELLAPSHGGRERLTPTSISRLGYEFDEQVDGLEFSRLLSDCGDNFAAKLTVNCDKLVYTGTQISLYRVFLGNHFLNLFVGVADVRLLRRLEDAHQRLFFLQALRAKLNFCLEVQL